MEQFTNPYAAQIAAIQDKLKKGPAPMYAPEEVAQRRMANDQQYQLGLLGQLSGDETLGNVGGQVFKQANAQRQQRVTDSGTFDPITGTFTANPEAERQRTEQQLNRLQSSAAQAEAQWQEQRQRATERADQERVRAQERAEARADRAALLTASRQQTDARRASDSQTRVAGQLYDDWYQGSKKDLEVKASFQNLASTPASAQGDISFIFQYMKMLDPGSVVREGEFATAQNAGGVSDVIRNTYNRVLNGQRLNPQQRAGFIATAKQLHDAASQRMNQRNRFFIKRAESAGVDPSLVIPDLAPSEPSAPTPGAAAPKAQQRAVTVDY